MIKHPFVVAISIPCFIALTGCTSTYSAPRTVPAGELRHAVLIESTALNTRDEMHVAAARYQLRVGVLDRVDVGVQTSGLMLGGDVKWNPIRSVIDVAIQGRAEVALTPRLFSESEHDDAEKGRTTTLQPMLLIGVNPIRKVSFIVLGGPAWIDAQGTKFTALRGGIGLNFRPTRYVSIQPEVQLVRTLRADERHTGQCCVVLGIGMAWGPTLEYADIDDAR